MSQTTPDKLEPTPKVSSYAELHCISNFSFLRGASHPHELITEAARLGYQAIAITDECSLAGVVKAHVKQQELESHQQNIQLIIGSEFLLPDQSKLVALVPNKQAYEELSAFITLCRRRGSKGEYQIILQDLNIHLQHCLIIFLPYQQSLSQEKKQPQEQLNITSLRQHPNLWVGVQRFYSGEDESHYQNAYRMASLMDKPMVACGNVHMHSLQRKPLQDVLTAIRKKKAVSELGKTLYSNGEHYLRPIKKLRQLFPEQLLKETITIAKRCHFSLKELRYQYPSEIIPPGITATEYLKQLAEHGAKQRWKNGIPDTIQLQIDKELKLISELNYEYFFLTVHDLVSFAREQGILCQGRGSAANSVICYCLFITEVDPSRAKLLFERFISKERNEPPDIDVDFEHERREEVIQYIYKKYTRERAALAATVITYRARSAIRDVGKALGFNSHFTEQLSKSLGWWHRHVELEQRMHEAGIDSNKTAMATLFLQLVSEIQGFPRHLSQHVGGFIISDGPLSRLVPIENANMPERTVIQWDKEDIEALCLLKVDVLALGMLSAIRKALDLVNQNQLTNNNKTLTISDIPDNDTATFDMLCKGDSIGVFQVESRAQISMLPRLKPRTFYDLVIQVAIVRPGPIQGDMVHPYLRRREGSEAVSYETAEIRSVLSRTLGIPIFQEQVIKLAMVAAGFSGGEADQLRRAMASWGKNGNLLQFREKLLNGMEQRGYDSDFAERVFNQMKGFGSYGFPESHAASFALLVYISSWLKCHYSAAFYAALINSQPMGFYSPSQLIQDAKRRGIKILPIDVQHSEWDCTLECDDRLASDCTLENNEALDQQTQTQSIWAIRLGLRLIQGLRKETAKSLLSAREQAPFSSLRDLIRRAKLNNQDRTALIQSNAVFKLSGNRHQSHWQNLAVDHHAMPLENAYPTQQLAEKTLLNDDILLAPPSEVQEIQADYSHTGLTLQRHPMHILRKQAPFNQCKRCIDLQQLKHGRFVQVAGIVTGRQRPGTASGVIFLTLEDETGNHNIIIWKNLQERCREPLLKSKLLLVKGVMEKKHSVIHIVAGQLIDCSEHLADFLLSSRDFH